MYIAKCSVAGKFFDAHLPIWVFYNCLRWFVVLTLVLLVIPHGTIFWFSRKVDEWRKRHLCRFSKICVIGVIDACNQ
jgi:hypothetical protein